MNAVSPDDEPLPHTLHGFEAEYMRWHVLMKGLCTCSLHTFITRPSLLCILCFCFLHTFMCRVHTYHFRPKRVGQLKLMLWRGRPFERNHHRCSFKRVGHTRAIHCWRSFRTIRTGLLCRHSTRCRTFATILTPAQNFLATIWPLIEIVRCLV